MTTSSTTIDRLRERPRAPRRRRTDRVIRSIRGIEAWHAARRRDVDGVAVLSHAEQRQHEAIVLATSQQLEQSGDPLDDSPSRTVVVVAPPDDVGETLSSALARAGLVVVARCWDAASAVGFAVAEQPDFVLVAGDMAGHFTRDAADDVAQFAPATTLVILGAGCDVDLPAGRRVQVVPGSPPASLVGRWMAAEVPA